MGLLAGMAGTASARSPSRPVFQTKPTQNKSGNATLSPLPSLPLVFAPEFTPARIASPQLAETSLGFAPSHPGKQGTQGSNLMGLLSGMVRCAFFDRILHSKIPYILTPLLRLKCCHAGDQ
jgi:hypothetical protein